MQLFARVAAVLLLSAGVLAENNSTTKWPEVVGVMIVPKSLEDHHTDKYKIEDGFVVRRGRPFELIITLDESLEHDDQAIIMQNDDKPGRILPKWETALKEKLGNKQYLVEVRTPINTAIGRFNDVSFQVVTIDEKGHFKHTHEAYEYAYPFPVYIVFDPWNPEDKKVYCPDEDIVKDTLLNEYGKVFDGAANDHRTIMWYYGHFREVALEAAFHILAKAEPEVLRDPYEVAKFISHNTGVVEVGNGELRGNKEGVLRGRWEDTFPGGRDPDTWVSTYDILKIWKETGEPTKYGQCWVFAACQNTMLRTLGFAARQLSCFGARIDASEKTCPHKIKHHVVREYYDKNAKMIYSQGSVWNYHSWNDVWLNREDEQYSGWNGIDATPPGLAFGSVKAVREQLDHYPWVTYEFVSTTHSRVERYLATCPPLEPGQKKRPSLEGCDIKSLISYDSQGVRSMLTSAPDASGEKVCKALMLGGQDITLEYVDPDKDAYIPEGSHHPHPWVRPHPKPAEEREAPFKVRVEPHATRVQVGGPVDVVVAVDYEKAAGGSPALDVAVTLDLVDNFGNIVREAHSSVQRMDVSDGHGELSLQITPTDYVHLNMKDKFIEVRALVTDPQTGDVVMEKRSVVMDGPKLRVMAPPLVSASSEDPHEIQVHVENPHDFPIERMCVKAHTSGHAIRLHGDAEHCVSLGANEATTITKHILPPTEEGSHTLVLTLEGDFMPVTVHHVPITATQDRVGLAAHRLQ